MHRRFIGAARAGRFAQPEDAPHVAGGGQNGVLGGQQAGGFAFVGFGHQENAAVRHETVDAAVHVGREQHLPLQSQQVVDVLLLGGPQGLDRVVRVDPVDRGFLNPGEIHRRRELSGDLRGAGGSLGVAAVCACFGSGGFTSGPGPGLCASTVMLVVTVGVPRACGRALGGLRGGLRLPGDGAAQPGGVHGAIRHGHDGADLGQIGIVEHEGLVLGRNAVEDSVRLGARQQASLRVHRQAGDVRLPGIVVDLALAGAETRYTRPRSPVPTYSAPSGPAARHQM